jgi:hypothetical protein
MWYFIPVFKHLLDYERINSSLYVCISIQPWGRVRQEPEPGQATGMTLAHRILGKFLGVGCHYFPPPLEVPTFASRCLHVLRHERPLLAKDGRPVKFCLWFRLPRKFTGIFDMPQSRDMGQTALLPLRRKACCGFFFRNSSLSARNSTITPQLL